MRTTVKGDGLPMGWVLVLALVQAATWIAITKVVTDAAISIAKVIWQ